MTPPPADWFDNPLLDGPTPIEVDSDGRVYGHIATWGTCHIGYMGVCTEPPRSSEGYPYFHLGVLECGDGSEVHVGKITMRAPHADIDDDWDTAARHYDHTGMTGAYVRAGEDSYGIWVAGCLHPDVDASSARGEFRASPPSGDWRPINGRHEMVGVLSVNVPGFPVLRARVAGGQLQALVAAGALRPSIDRDLTRLLGRVDPDTAIDRLAARVL